MSVTGYQQDQAVHPELAHPLDGCSYFPGLARHLAAEEHFVAVRARMALHTPGDLSRPVVFGAGGDQTEEVRTVRAETLGEEVRLVVQLVNDLQYPRPGAVRDTDVAVDHPRDSLVRHLGEPGTS